MFTHDARKRNVMIWLHISPLLLSASLTKREAEHSSRDTLPLFSFCHPSDLFSGSCAILRRKARKIGMEIRNVIPSAMGWAT